MKHTKYLETSGSRVDKDAEDIVNDCMKYEKVGKYILCPLEDIVERESRKGINNINLHIDTPSSGDTVWCFDKPYEWDGFFPTLAENHGYGRGNFDEMIDDKLLIWYDDEEDSYHLSPKAPHQITKEEEDSCLLSSGTHNKVTKDKASRDSSTSKISRWIPTLVAILYILIFVLALFLTSPA